MSSHDNQLDAGDVPRSLGRALDLLELVAERGELSLTSAAAGVGLTPTTARRHLLALEARGYVHRDPAGSFSVGPSVVRLAAIARRRGPYARLVEAAQPALDALATATGESAYLAVRDGDRAVYLATAESRRSIRHVGWVGRSVPLAGTAVGDVLAGACEVSRRTGTVEPDIAAVAGAVRVGDDVVAAISVIGPAHRFDEAAMETVHAALVDAVDDLGRAVGSGLDASQTDEVAS
jgi:urocanate hydratase